MLKFYFRNRKGCLFVCILAVLVLFIGIMPGTTWAQDPIEIWNADDLNNMRDNLSGNYILMNDIDLSDTVWGTVYNASNPTPGWEPIGTFESPFTGTFDGNGHTITGLYIDRPNKTEVGLFGVPTETTIIKDLGLLNIYVKGFNYVGSMVGSYNYQAGKGSTITNCYTTGTVTGHSYVGGLIGGNIGGGAINNSYTTVAVIGFDNNGGLVGHNNGCITNSYATGTVTESEYNGGLVGYRQGGTITNSYYNSETTGRGEVGVGQGSSSGVTGLATAEMKQQATFSSWDFNNNWGIDEGATYPIK